PRVGLRAARRGIRGSRHPAHRDGAVARGCVKIDRSTAAAALLAGSLAAAVSLGVPHEGMLQDTFKSAVVAIGALLAALVFAWLQGGQVRVLHGHAVLLLPFMLCAYALGSIAWSLAWPAGVEAVRWFLFALIATLALQLFREPRRQAILAWSVTAGGILASMWVVLQLFFGVDLFPQGSRPGSTFVNRNFFAEFAVCTLPFFAYLLAQERRRVNQALVAVAAGLVMLAIGMTGARAALVALALLVVGAVASHGTRKWMLIALVPVVVLAAIPTGDAQ